jgi:hypothetical protein
MLLPKCLLTFNGLHGVTYQNLELFEPVTLVSPPEDPPTYLMSSPPPPSFSPITGGFLVLLLKQWRTRLSDFKMYHFTSYVRCFQHACLWKESIECLPGIATRHFSSFTFSSFGRNDCQYGKAFVVVVIIIIIIIIIIINFWFIQPLSIAYRSFITHTLR